MQFLTTHASFLSDDEPHACPCNQDSPLFPFDQIRTCQQQWSHRCGQQDINLLPSITRQSASHLHPLPISAPVMIVYQRRRVSSIKQRIDQTVPQTPPNPSHPTQSLAVTTQKSQELPPWLRPGYKLPRSIPMPPPLVSDRGTLLLSPLEEWKPLYPELCDKRAPIEPRGHWIEVEEREPVARDYAYADRNPTRSSVLGKRPLTKEDTDPIDEPTIMWSTRPTPPTSTQPNLKRQDTKPVNESNIMWPSSPPNSPLLHQNPFLRGGNGLVESDFTFEPHAKTSTPVGRQQ